MSKPLTISTAPLEHPAMDYSFLRQEGIRHLERLAGQLWTDFNAHDPGITILEQVCYALTDLAHRINYPLPDLLSSDDANPYASLYRPNQILPSYPVTINDLRKLVIDVKGVKNAWVEKVEEQAIPLYFDASNKALTLQRDAFTVEPIYLQGLYSVVIDAPVENREAVLKQVRHRLHAHRGLGEDFEAIQALNQQDIQVQARIEIDTLDDASSVLLEIYQRLADYISPPIRFSSLREQLQAGKRVDEIFDGPLLEHGFIDSEVLKRAQHRRTVLRTSDLIQEMMNVPGVKAVRHISISTGDKNEPWSLDLDPSKAPRLDLSGSNKGSNIRLERNRLEANIDVASVREAYYQRLRQSETAPNPLDLQPPTGRDRKVENYYSIQHQFPATYGIGAMGLPDSAPPSRKAQAKQLQGYLMFFDQLLANYFSQLAHVKDLFSFTKTAQTYFSQAITDPTLGINDIRVTENPSGANNTQVDFGRRNRFLNHLLARFAEQFIDYSLPEKCKKLARVQDKGKKLAQVQDKGKKLAQDKQAFLQDYIQLSQARGTVAGLEKRLRCKLGIVETEHFYIIEHIRLRPMAGDIQQQKPLLEAISLKDPYSLQLSLVFPKETSRSKAFVERTIREETPAHLSLTLYWLEKEAMGSFASAYSDWQKYWQEQAVTTTTQIQLRDARDRLIDLLGLGETYPLRDLVVRNEQLMVAFNTPAKIQIENSQKGVLYQLHYKHTPVKKVPGGETIKKEGTGGTIILETYKITEDITFEIFAKKEQSGKEAYLHQTAAVKVGIDKSLKAEIQNVPYLENTKAITPRPRITDYGTSVTVKIQKSQEGVDYRLVSTGNTEKVLSKPSDVRGNSDDITLTTELINEDVDIRIRATKTYDDSDKKAIIAIVAAAKKQQQDAGGNLSNKANNSIENAITVEKNKSQDAATLETAITAAKNELKDTETLDVVLPLKVRANPDLSVSVAPPIIDYNKSATIKIANTQKSSTYQLYIRPIPVLDFIHGTVPKVDVIKVKVSDKHYAQVRKPSRKLVWEKTPEGYTAWGKPKVGTGSDDILQFTLDPLMDDHLVIIKAQKEHQVTVIEKIPSAVQLEQAAVVLVRPNPAPSLSLEKTETSGELKVSGGQQGVFYYFRLTSNGDYLGLPAYFHKLNKGLNQLKIEVDYVITGLPGALEAPILETGSLLDDATTLHVHAMKAQTRVAIPLSHTVNITSTAD